MAKARVGNLGPGVDDDAVLQLCRSFASSATLKSSVSSGQVIVCVDSTEQRDTLVSVLDGALLGGVPLSVAAEETEPAALTAASQVKQQAAGASGDNAGDSAGSLHRPDSTSTRDVSRSSGDDLGESKAPVTDPDGYIDTHIHLEYVMSKKKLGMDGFTGFRKQHYPSNYQGCISIACDVDSWRPTVKLMQHDATVYAAFGIHPHNAGFYDDDQHARLLELMKHPRCVAWGECGLDYHYNHSPPDAQRYAFSQQLLAAVSLEKPVVIHTRKADDDTLAVMRACLPKKHVLHIHCMGDSLTLAQTAIAEFPNAYFGFTGNITFNNAAARRIARVVEAVPLRRILLETDGPHMSPAGRRDVCHSGHVPVIAARIADIKQVSVSDVYAACRANTRAVYGI